jgi:hypothetical protein
MIPCPIGRLSTIADADTPSPCPTELQRTAAGTLADGVATHLAMVHGVPDVAAKAIGNHWVRQYKAAGRWTGAEG